MNNIEKQFKKQKKKRNSSTRKWWKKNKHKIARVVLFYIWIPILLHEKIKNTRYKNLTYSNDTTQKYLDKVMPKLVYHYEEDPNLILFHDTEDFGGIRFYWDLCSNWMRKTFKKETRYFGKFNKEVKNYIIQEYNIDGYKKMILSNWADWRKAQKLFGWYSTPYNADYANGVVFYKGT
jgi:hypothetical protein